jgi:hypothetical protein
MPEASSFMTGSGATGKTFREGNCGREGGSWIGLESTILILDGTQVSDTGLAHLKGLTNLGSLSLSGTQVSDAGLPHLTGLVRLSVLWLKDTHVRDAGIRELKQALPSLTIYH